MEDNGNGSVSSEATEVNLLFAPEYFFGIKFFISYLMINNILKDKLSKLFPGLGWEYGNF